MTATKEAIASLVLKAMQAKVDSDTYGVSHALKINADRAEKAADEILARTPALPSGEVMHPLSEIREWDEALAVLGIQDSDQTPADAIRERDAEIERLRAIPFSRWADIIESASLTISPKGSEALNELAAEVRAGGVAQAAPEPVAWRWNTRADQRWRVTIKRPVPTELTAFDKIEPLYAAPQPVDPMTRDCPECRGAKIVGGPRYHATGTLTDAWPCPRCRSPQETAHD